LREKNGGYITEIAMPRSFNSSQYFATCFRRRFKMTPSQFVAAQHHASGVVQK